MPSTAISYSHQDSDLDETAEKLYDALTVYRNALNEGVEKYLIGRPVKPTFRKFN